MLTGRQRLYLEAIGIDLWVSRAPPGEARVVAVPAAPIRAPAVPDEVAAAEWQRLSDEVRGCRLCPLHATRTQDRRGEPFVGAAGQLLDAMLRAIGLDRRTNVYIANVLKSRPPNNRDPKPEEVEACLPYLVRQIALLQPKIMLAVGRIAAQNLLATDAPLGRLRGRVHRFGEQQTPLVVTYHPAYLLRTPTDKRKAWEDLKFARSVYQQMMQGATDGHRC